MEENIDVFQAGTDEKALISIVIPAYNVEHYIQKCLDSIWEQTYKNYEIIIINDGSTDNTLKAIGDFVDRFTGKLRVIDVANSGVSIARNIGIDMANGEYVCFVDADDMLHPRYLEYMETALRLNPHSAIAIAGVMKIKEKCDKPLIYNMPISYAEYECLDILRMMLFHKLKAGIWCLLIRLHLLKDLELKFAEGYKYSEDLEMVWRLVLNSRKVVLLDNQLYYYRKRKSSAMYQFTSDRLDGFYLFLKLEQYIKEKQPVFYKEFHQYGVAYWINSTVRQAAELSDSYMLFMKNIEDLDAELYLKKLKSYPKYFVRLMSQFFLLCPHLYFIIVNKLAKVYRR